MNFEFVPKPISTHFLHVISASLPQWVFTAYLCHMNIHSNLQWCFSLLIQQQSYTQLIQTAVIFTSLIWSPPGALQHCESAVFLSRHSQKFVLIQLMFCSWWSPMKPSSSTFLLSATALNSDTALCNCWSLSNWCQFSIDWIYYIPFICKTNEIQYHKDNGLIMCWYFNCPISWLENVNGFPNQNRY